MESLGICPDRSWQSIKERFNKTILNNLANFNVTRTQLMKADKARAVAGVSGKGATEQTGSSRRPFSRSDDEAILKHILAKQDFSRVAGNELWVEMERLEVVSGRSWQSLKEHFRKIIMRNIHSFRFLTKGQRSSLKARKIVKEDEDVEKVECVTDVETEVEEAGEQDWTLEEACSEEACPDEAYSEKACSEGWQMEEDEVEEVHVSYILVDF